MSGDAYLAGAQARAEARMRSRAKVWRKAKVALDTATLDIVGGDQADGDKDQDVVPGLESSPCRVRSTSSAVFTQDAEGMLLAAQDVVVSFPVAKGVLVHARDEIEILDGGPNPALTGRRFVVTGIPAQTDATAHRFPVEQTS